MNILVSLREKIKGMYAEYDVFFRPVLKFALALILFTVMNNWLGYLGALNSLFIIVILAVICALPLATPLTWPSAVNVTFLASALE